MTEYESGLGTTVVWLLLWGLIGYFTYGQTVNGALGMILLSILAGLSVLVACIPIAGIALQYITLEYWLFPWVLGVTGLTESWATALVFWIYMTVGAIVWLYITYIVIKKVT